MCFISIQGSKHRLSLEDELLPPAKHPRTIQPSSASDSVGSSGQPNGVCQEGQVSEKTNDLSATDSQDIVSSVSSVQNEREHVITFSTPDSQLAGSSLQNEREHVITLSTPDSQLLSEEIDSDGGRLDLDETREAVADTPGGDKEQSEMSLASTMEKPLESNSEPPSGTSVNRHPSPTITTDNTEPIVADDDSTQLPLERKPAEEIEELSVVGDLGSPAEEATSMETEPSNNQPSLGQDEVASKEVPMQCADEENVVTEEAHPGTAALLDHSYCSQENSPPFVQPQESEDVSDGLKEATKLSLVNYDHTYCYSSDLALEQPSSLADTQTQSEEVYLTRSELSQSDTSQELFSCNQSNLDDATNVEQGHVGVSVDSNNGTPSSSESHHAECSQMVTRAPSSSESHHAECSQMVTRAPSSSSESHHAECSQMVTRETQTTSPELSNTAVNTDLLGTTTAVPQVSVSELQAMVGKTTADTGILTCASVDELLALQEKLFELQQLVQQRLSKAMRERP